MELRARSTPRSASTTSTASAASLRKPKADAETPRRSPSNACEAAQREERELLAARSSERSLGFVRCAYGSRMPGQGLKQGVLDTSKVEATSTTALGLGG